MDKETLSNYGWIVICVLVLSVMIALASPFGQYVASAVETTTQGLFDVNDKALGAVGAPLTDGLPPDTDTMIYRLSSLDPNITYTDFEITQDNRAKIGYTGAENENLVIPVAFLDDDGTWYRVTSIGDWAFGNCTSLTSVVIGDSVTSIGEYAFSICDSLTSINIPDSVTSIGYYAFEGCTSLTSVVIGDSVTSIDDSAFHYCTSLTSIEIPDSVTSIGDSAFDSVPHITYNGAASGAPWGAKSIN